jgi:hypothetical protein
MKCSYEMCPNAATHMAPQVTDTPGVWAWKPICSEDQNAWWDGGDPEDIAAAPPIQTIKEWEAAQ